jgi:hypothetical protein
MAANDHADGNRAEPIDADFEPARHGGAGEGVGMGTAVVLAVISALGGGALGALAPRTPALAPLLDAAAPDELTQVREAQAAANRALAEAKEKLRAIDVAGGVSPEFKADYLQLKADVAKAQDKIARIDVGLKLFPNGPEETQVLRNRILALEAVPKDPAAATPQQLARATATLQVRVAELEKRAGKSLAFEAAAGASPAEIMARLGAVQGKQKDLETKLAAAATTAQVAAVSGDVQKLQSDFSDVAKGAKAASDAARAAFAVAAATDASRSSGPFEQAYAALQSVLPDDPNVIALGPLSRKGAPTRNELRDEFARIELEIVRAARQAESGGGVWGQVQASLAQFVVIRRAGETADADSLVDNASARIAADDLEGAVAQLSRLTGPPARVVAPWLQKARLRVEIDQRLAAIRTQLSRKG